MGRAFLVDSSVLLALLRKSESAGPAQDLLLRAHAAGPLVFNGIVAAEVSPAFETANEFIQAMEELGLHYFDFRMETAIVAGRLWKKYRLAGGKRRERIIADFIIAACAMECGGLVTLDEKFPHPPGLHIFH